MSLCRTWRQHTGKTDTILDQTGLRYDAGDWFAEILGDSWKSYDVIKRVKVSQEEWQETLQPHSVPRLPYQCFAVEEFQYQQSPSPSPSPQKHQQQHQQQQIQAQAYCIGGWIVEESHLPLTQLQQEVERKEQEQQQEQGQRQPEQPKPIHRRNTRPMISGRLSSNQSSHVIQQSEYPKKQARHSQPNKQVMHSPKQGTPIDQWTPLQPHLSLQPQHQVQVASFEGQKGRPKNSLPQPRRLPRQSQLKRSSSSHVQSVQPLSSVCQIQD